jgi:hypothetical protein
MPSKKLTPPDQGIDNLICEIRGQKVILDSDLARVYGVSTKRLNEQFRRNRNRFPEDFAFQLTATEVTNLRSQIATLKKGDQSDALNWSQFATSSSKHRGKVYRPWAFTEHGALQAANILNSARAAQMSVFVIRAFVKMRDELAANSAMVKRLAQIDNTLFLHDSALRDPWLAVALAKAALPKAAPTSHAASVSAAKAAHRFPSASPVAAVCDRRNPNRQIDRVPRQRGYPKQPQKSDPTLAPRRAVRFTISPSHNGQRGAAAGALTLVLTADGGASRLARQDRTARIERRSIH